MIFKAWCDVSLAKQCHHVDKPEYTYLFIFVCERFSFTYPEEQQWIHSPNYILLVHQVFLLSLTIMPLIFNANYVGAMTYLPVPSFFFFFATFCDSWCLYLKIWNCHIWLTKMTFNVVQPNRQTVQKV